MSLGIAIALLVGLAGAIVVACYDLPRPDCGFGCGANHACPDDYTCASDHYCHRIGAPASLVCGPPDAAIAGEATNDALNDAVDAVDAVDAIDAVDAVDSAVIDDAAIGDAAIDGAAM